MYCNVLADVRPSQIGKAFPSCSLYVISLGGELLPKGCIGELCVGGPQVTRGYLNRDEVTSKSFVTGYAGIPERIYRTGDMCRMLDDGSIEFCGRKDNQVKLNGRRIELESVTSVLQVRYPDIKYVTCLLRNPSSGKLQLITFLCSTLDLTTSIDNSDILDVVEESFNYAWDNLPSYMVPNMMIPIASEPSITTNGKLDLVSLQRMYENLLQMVGKELLVKLSGNFSAETPALKLEEELLIIVGKLLKLEPSSIDVNLHLNSYGLDSLSSVSLSHELKNVGYSVKSSDILKHGSVRRVSLLMKSSSAVVSLQDVQKIRRRFSLFCEGILGEKFSIDALENSIPNLVKGDIDSLLPCTPGQIFWLDSWVQSEKKEYLFTFCLQSRLPIDKKRLSKIWNRIVEENASLRTGFICTGINQLPWIQCVLKSGQISLNNLIISQTYSNNYIKHYIAKKKVQFDIIVKPPVEMELLSFNDKDIICINILHAMYDGWSLDIILNQLQTLYHNPLQAISPNYVNSTVFGAGQMLADILSKSTECSTYWIEELKALGNNQSIIKRKFQPRDVLRQPLLQCYSCLGNASSSKQETKNFVLFGKVPLDGFKNEILTSIILASYAKVLAKALQQSTVIFGLFHMGRIGTEIELESSTWSCMNIAPMIVHSASDQTIEKIANQIRDRLQKSSNYQQISLKEVHNLVGATKPLFNTFVNILKASKSKEPTSKSTSNFTTLDVNNGKSSAFNQSLQLPTNPRPPNLWMTEQILNYERQSRITREYLSEDFHAEFVINENDIKISVGCKTSVYNYQGLAIFLRDLESELVNALSADSENVIAVEKYPFDDKLSNYH
ncbi:hypothetical protein BC833DRAFT_350906 [Globomyces pollinis-pini]|nr:hypothetical protein BC833DRAFT_350906 [Globomyces pollinis-pini]